MAAVTVPVLVLTGPVGAGKTSVAMAASELLDEARVPHALIDLDWLRWCRPSPDADPFQTALGYRNLAAVWRSYRAAGAARLLLVDVVESQAEQVAAYEAAIPGARIVVVRLHAPVDTLHCRLRRRESGSSLEWHLRRAVELEALMEQRGIGDLRVNTEGRPVDRIAREILERTGWTGG